MSFRLLFSCRQVREANSVCVARDASPAVGGQLSAVGRFAKRTVFVWLAMRVRLSAVSCQRLAAGGWLSAVGCRLAAVGGFAERTGFSF